MHLLAVRGRPAHLVSVAACETGSNCLAPLRRRDESGIASRDARCTGEFRARDQEELLNYNALRLFLRARDPVPQSQFEPEQEIGAFH